MWLAETIDYVGNPGVNWSYVSALSKPQGGVLNIQILQAYISVLYTHNNWVEDHLRRQPAKHANCEPAFPSGERS